MSSLQYEKINIEVDSYEMGYGELKCLCVYATLNTECEDRIITLNQLRNHVAYTNDMVQCWGYQDGNGDVKSYSIAFGTWFEQNKNTVEFLDTLSDIINKREGRKPLNHIVTFPETLTPYITELKVKLS